MSDGNGLQLHVFANGRKTRIYSYRYNGKQKILLWVSILK
ncbi:hypothetical protein ACT4YY_13445 [Acinetobacter baumannii]